MSRTLKVSEQQQSPMEPYEEYQRPVTRHLLRECLAEFFGTFILMLFGDGVVAQTVLSKGTAGSYLGITLAWGIGVTMGIYVAGGVSGAHINPAVTFTLAVWKRFEWKKVPYYVMSQILGAFCAAAVVYGVYFRLIQTFDLKETAGIFATYPEPHQTALSALASEIVGSALLLGCIFAIGDAKNMPASSYSKPGAVGLLVVGIGLSFGYNTGYAINPARDFGPRLFTWVAGWGSWVFTTNNYYFWIPIVGPCIGGLIGAGAYTFYIERVHPNDEPKMSMVRNV